MATVDLSIRDNMSSGVKAATDSLNKLADAGDKASTSAVNLTATTSKVGPSFDTINKKIDENASLTAALTTINNRYQQGLAAVRAELEAGGISAEAATEKTSRLGMIRDASTASAVKASQALAAQFQTTTAATTAATGAADTMATTHGKVAAATDHASTASAGFTREILVLSHEVIQGNFSKIPGSLMVLTERSETLTKMVTGLMSGLIGWPGVAVAAGAALVALAVHENEVIGETNLLNATIAATGRTAELSSSKIMAYSAALSRNSELSKADAVALSDQLLAQNPGLTQAGGALIAKTAPDLSVALGTDTASAAKLEAEALSGSYAAIVKLDTATNALTADERVQIRTMLEHGDRAGATALAMDKFAKATDGARTNSLSPFKQMVEDISHSLSDMLDNLAKAPGQMAALEGNVPFSNNPTGFNIDGTVNMNPVVTQKAPLDPEHHGGNDQTALTKDQILQQKTVNDLSQAYDNENKVLQASLPARAAVKASLEADIKIRDLQLTGMDAAALKSKMVAAAVAQASDASNQQTAALSREASGNYKLADATMSSRAAAVLATAQNKANEIAMTQTGASASRLTKINLDLAVSQAAIDSANSLQSLRDSTVELMRLGDTTNSAEEHTASLANKTVELTQAYKAAVEASNDPTQIAHFKEVEQITADTVALQDQANTALQAKHSLEEGSRTLEYLQAELSTLSLSDGVRAETLAKLKQSQEIEAQFPGMLQATKDAQIAQAGAIANATTQLQTQQNAYSEISNFAQSAFSQIGQSISDAFISGSGAAVNFGNITKAIISSIVQEMLKLAIINPIIQSLGGSSSLPTLGSVSGAIGGGSGGSGMFGNLFSLASTGNSISGALGGPSLSSYLGLTAPGGSLTSVGGLLYAGMDSAAALPLGAGVYGPVASAAEATPGLLGGGFMGAGLGAWAGGIGGGFAAGSMLGGLVQGGLNKTGPAPTIGAGVGAVGGAIAGTLILPGVGTVIGGLLGGALGGAGGGLIGPHVANAYSSTLLSTQNGQLAVGNTLSQRYDPTSDVANLNAEVAQLNAALSANNLAISNRNIQIGTNTPGGYQDPTKFGSLDAAIGGYTFNSATDANLNDKISQQAFGSVQQVIDWLNKYNAAQAASAAFISGTTSTISSLNKTTGTLNDQIADITSGYNVVIDAGNQIIATNDLSAAQVDQMTDAENKLSAARDAAVKAASDAAAAQDAATQSGLESRYLSASATLSGNINDDQSQKLYTFDQSAIQQEAQYKQSLIQLYGDSVTSTEGYAADIALIEKTLGEERLVIVKQYNDQIASQFAQIVAYDSNLDVRYRTAQAAISGDPAQVENANLYSFDVNAQTQRDAFSKMLTDLYGDTFKSTSSYAAQMAGLEKTLGEERLEIVTQYNDQITQQTKQQTDQATSAASSLISSISQYVTNLEGSDSPLSPQAQLALQQSTFAKDTAASGAGDFGATSRLTSDASNLLNASKAYYGTGAGYVADYQKVLDALSTVSQTLPDTLTASAFASETQTQTATLVDSLADLKTQLVAIKLQLAQGSSAPKQLG